MAKRKIKNLPALLIKIGLNSAGKQIEKINDEYLRKSLSYLIDPAKGIVSALSDKNMNDKQQVQEIVNKFLPGFIALNEAQILKKISEIKNDDLRKVLVVLTPVFVAIINLLLDENEDNETQIKELLLNTVTVSDFRGLIESLVKLFSKDELVVEGVMQFIDGIIEIIFFDEFEEIEVS